jgi:predicted MFS family arabinose efflux permease
MSGTAVGQLVIISLVASVLAYLGWRKAYGLLGVVNFLVVMWLVTLLRGGFRRFAPSSETSQSVTATSRVATAGVLAIPGIRLLMVVYTICGLQDFFVATHVVAFATDHGVKAVVAGTVFALMGLMGLIGVLASGVLVDAYGPTLPTSLCFLVRLGLFGYIPFVQDETSIIMFALLYGVTFLVTAPLIVIFALHAAGPTYMGRVSGLLSMVHQIAGGLGAFLGGSVFDRWGSYDNAFVLMFLLSGAAAYATWLIRDKPVAPATLGSGP